MRSGKGEPEEWVAEFWDGQMRRSGGRVDERFRGWR